MIFNLQENSITLNCNFDVDMTQNYCDNMVMRIISLWYLEIYDVMSL